MAARHLLSWVMLQTRHGSRFLLIAQISFAGTPILQGARGSSRRRDARRLVVGRAKYLEGPPIWGADGASGGGTQSRPNRHPAPKSGPPPPTHPPPPVQKKRASFCELPWKVRLTRMAGVSGCPIPPAHPPSARIVRVRYAADGETSDWISGRAVRRRHRYAPILSPNSQSGHRYP